MSSDQHSAVGIQRAAISSQQAAGRRSWAAADIQHSTIRDRHSAFCRLTSAFPHPGAHRRRGVLLLVVLSLLILFVMIAVAYVLVASRHLKSNVAIATKDRVGEPPNQLLDAAMRQVLVGSNNLHSVVYPHSLLEDIYGNKTVQGVYRVPSSPPLYPRSLANGSIFEFAATLTGSTENPSLTTINEPDDYYDGCIITMTTGAAKGLSARVVKSISANPALMGGANQVFRVPAVAGAGSPADGDQFIINGRAFSGTGAGLNHNPLSNDADTLGMLTARNGDAQTNDTPIDVLNPLKSLGGRKQFALLPNPAFYDPLGIAQSSLVSDYDTSVPFGGYGGANEDYDAPDYQNMFLGMIVDGNFGGQVRPYMVIPSYHRPDLINYWFWRCKAWLADEAIIAPSPTEWSWLDTITPANNKPYTDARGNIEVPSAHLLRQIMLRPNPIDHPNFTGSNPAMASGSAGGSDAAPPTAGWQLSMVMGPWDVDNDGDGVNDSVWLDLGYPVQATSDGRLYKPLFAILCLDMDGRLNLNAHGTTEQADDYNARSTYSVDPGPYAGIGSFSSVPLMRGEGSGPAEVDLGAAGFTAAQIANLMRGDSSRGLPGRYTGASPESPGSAEASQTGSNSNNKLAFLQHFQWTDNLKVAPFSSFGSPGDLWGRMGVGLDLRGQPLFWKPRWDHELVSNPYGLNLSLGGTNYYDDPFKVYELERLLRPNDIDSTALPDRLWRLTDLDSLAASNAGLAAHRARSVTSDSWDLPSPNIAVPPFLRNDWGQLQLFLAKENALAASNTIPYFGRGGNDSVMELLITRILHEKFLKSYRNNIKQANPTFTAAQVEQAIATALTPGGAGSDPALQAQILTTLNPATATSAINIAKQLLSPELANALRMNINRPLGDGRDDDGNGVVDEPSSSTTGETSLEAQGMVQGAWKTVFGNVQQNLINGRDLNKSQLLARQLLAKDLYVLARLVIDDDYLEDSSGVSHVDWFTEQGLTDDNKKELAIRRIAQWAVNVVDFMDPDNIMTPFEYDVNPWDGWDVNDDYADNSTDGPDRRLVWGCERPELLITETQAFHDLRIADTKFDNGIKSTTTDPSNKDPNYDQVRIPQGSAFFELYCTANPNQPQQSGDLYTNVSGNWYLQLDKMAPASANGLQYPVWRMVITEPNTDITTGNKAVNDIKDMVDATKDPTKAQSDANFGGFVDQFSYDTKQTVSADTVKHYPSLLTSPPTDLQQEIKIERIIWFTNTDPSPYPDGARTYYRRLAPGINDSGAGALLGPGKYAVIGPRKVTRLGWTSRQGSGDYGASATTGISANEPAKQRFVVDSTSGRVQIYLDDGTNTPDQEDNNFVDYPTSDIIQAPLPMIVAAGNQNLIPTASHPGGGPNSKAGPWGTSDTDNPYNFQDRFPFGIGISVSEPLITQYYAEPSTGRSKFETTDEEQVANDNKIYDCYAGLQQDPSDKYRFLDNPEDNSAGRPLYNDSTHNMVKTGTYTNYKTVVLQRLANPLAPWDETLNPYITVDWMPIDLTVFNGQDTANGNDSDPTNTVTPPPGTYFSSRQRGSMQWYRQPPAASAFNPTFNTNYNILAQISDDPPENDNKTTAADVFFQYEMKYYSNPPTATNPPSLPPTLATTNGATVNNGTHSWGFLNSSYGYPLTGSELTAAGLPTGYIGDPRKPFPWLVWNNRPYANVGELMMVPACSAGRLLYEFVAPELSNSEINQSKFPDIYSSDRDDMAGAAPWTNIYGNNAQQRIPYANLLDMFHSSSDSTKSANLSLIFDYLQVPSPFVGTETQLNPFNFTQFESGATDTIPTPPAVGNGTAGLHPPFSSISNYRDPGRVNVNTITGLVGLDASGNYSTGSASSEVWNGILGGTVATTPTPTNPIIGPTFEQLLASRRGFGLPTVTSLTPSPYSPSPDPTINQATPVMNSLYPSIFSNPFRTAAADSMVPLVGAQATTASTTVDLRHDQVDSGAKPINGPIDATLLRQGIVYTLPPAQNTYTGISLMAPNLDSVSLNEYNKYTRNPYFETEALGRNLNKLTTHSNVFAVWVTVGYFQVTPWYGFDSTTGAAKTTGAQTFDTGHPDGYQLGPELGSDIGQIERHRGFYIIDRSIPVGFQRGIDNNTNNAVILKRFIE